MSDNHELIRHGLLFSELWDIGVAFYDIDADNFYFTSQKFTMLTGINGTFTKKGEGNPLQNFISTRDYKIIKKILHLIRTKKENRKKSLHEVSFYMNVQFGQNGQITPLTFILRVEASSEKAQPNSLIVLCITEQLYGYERFILYNFNKNTKLYYSESTERFVQKKQIELTRIEKEILSYANEGFNEQKTANVLRVDLNLIKYYKKNIFRKLHVGTISEAIYIAIHCGII